MITYYDTFMYILFRDKAQIEKKAMVNKMEEDDNDRRKGDVL